MQNRILTSRFVQRATVALGAAALPALSFAQGLPQLENPTRGTGNGIMETIRNYGYDIIMLERQSSEPEVPETSWVQVILR